MRSNGRQGTDDGRSTVPGVVTSATSSVRASVTRCLSALFGMPNYPRYLDHQRRCHPDAPVLSEREFVESELKRKYDGGGARCC